MQNQVSESLISQGFPLTGKYHHGITGLAKKLASKYQQVNNEDDFCQIALLTACTYEKKFDETNGASFYTFVAEPIKTSIHAEFGNPNAGSKLYKKLSKFIQEFQLKESCYPTMDDIVIGTKISRFKVMEIYFDRARDISIDSIDEIHEEDNSWVLDYLGILNEEEQKIITLVFFEELSLNEAALTLDKPFGYISKTLHAILEKLKLEIKGK